MSNEVAEGIYFGMPEDVYHAAAGLSNSGIKHLSVSPLNYWHVNLNPDYVREETSFQRIGKALHCRLLEPERFASSYAKDICKDDYPDVLDTIDDLKAYCQDNELPVTAKRKQDLIDRIKEAGLEPLIWDEVKAAHAAEIAGKVVLKAAEHDLIESAAKVAEADKCVSGLLKGGMAEVSFFVRDPETCVMLKARMDYVKRHLIVDLKSFSNARGKAAKRAMFDALYYEGYYIQAVFYSKVRELARNLPVFGDFDKEWLADFRTGANGFGIVFIESDAPFDMAAVELVRSEAEGAQQNVYWYAGEIKIRESIELYAECRAKYGDKEWREPVEPVVLNDTDLPQLMFA
jgi:hypothetical protein